MKNLLFLILFLSPTLCFAQSNTVSLSDDVEVIQLNMNLYIHKSYTNSERFGRFSSNGLIYIQNNEALIADTPTDTIQTQLIVDWLLEQGIRIKAVVVNHHHSDALGGLSVFHKIGIPSYGFTKTATFASQKGLEAPKHTFTDSTQIQVGNSNVKLFHFGEGHTKDNALVWIPSEMVLFGGCMIKSLGSGKGNLEDANTSEWSNTVSRVQKKFPEIRLVIPGHGIYGSTELLDYTIQMFKE